MRRSLLVTLVLLVLGSNTGAPAASPVGRVDAPYRAFQASSYWNTPLCTNAPRDANSANMIEFLKSDNVAPFIKFAGVQSDGGWGNPIYWAKPTDPVYEVAGTRYTLPPEFSRLRIPSGAQPAATSDGEFTVYDLEAGGVAHLWRATYDAGANTWSADGGAYYYVNSNGLHGSVSGSDDRRNTGHRGAAPPVHAVRWDEVQAGSVDHVLKIAINTARRDFVFPMVGSDGNSVDQNAPPQGARLRIKPSVDLTRLGLSPAALVVSRALQQYGAMVGDQSGGATMLKVENTVAEGKGSLWDGVLGVDSLSAIPFDSYEFIRLGYNPADSPNCKAKKFYRATSDVHIVAKRPNRNFGANRRVRVMGGKRAIGLLRFDIVDGSQVSGAVLRLYSRSEVQGIDVRSVESNSWKERRVTWNRAPQLGPVIASAGPLGANSLVEIDVTSAIRDAGNHSFAITARSTVPALFDSKEAATGLAGELVITRL